MHYLKNTALAGIPLALGLMSAEAADGPQKRYSFQGVVCYRDCGEKYSYETRIAKCGKFPNVSTSSQQWKDYEKCSKDFTTQDDTCRTNCKTTIEKVKAELCPNEWVACNQQWTVERKACNDSKKPITSPANIQCQNEAKMKFGICQAGCAGDVLEYEGK